MPNMSNAFENQLIDFLFRGQPLTQPPALFVALFTTTPTDAAPGAEPTAPSYHRTGLACTLNNWSGTDAPASQLPSAGTSGMCYNIGTIKFPDPQEDWGNVAYIGIFDQVTGGNYLFWGQLLYPRDFVVGDVNIMFNPGEISFQIDN